MNSDFHTLYVLDMTAYATVGNLSIKDRRNIFSDMRRFEEGQLAPSLFLPKWGLFSGELCTSHVLLDIFKRKRT